MNRVPRLSFFVVTGRNARFGAVEIGRFLAANASDACRIARLVKAGLVGGLQLEARRV